MCVVRWWCFVGGNDAVVRRWGVDIVYSTAGVECAWERDGAVLNGFHVSSEEGDEGCLSVSGRSGWRSRRRRPSGVWLHGRCLLGPGFCCLESCLLCFIVRDLGIDIGADVTAGAGGATTPPPCEVCHPSLALSALHDQEAYPFALTQLVWLDVAHAQLTCGEVAALDGHGPIRDCFDL